MYYLAYGSNLHPLRLNERVHSAKHVGEITISGYKLKFNKIGVDGSGKCNIKKTNCKDSVVKFVLFRFNDIEKQELDKYESYGHGYDVHYIDLIVNGLVITAFTYIAMENYINNDLSPFSWYKSLVILGMKHYSFDKHYIEKIEKTKAIEDENFERVEKNTLLIKRIQGNNGLQLTLEKVMFFAVAKKTATFRHR